MLGELRKDNGQVRDETRNLVNALRSSPKARGRWGEQSLRNVLVQAGLVTLREEGLLDPSPADIDTEASEVEVTPVDAAQATLAYNEGTPAVINNSFLERAGIDPNSAIFQDDPSTEQAEQYINVWVTTPELADNEELQQLAELWKDPAVEEAVLESSGGTAVPVDLTDEELADIQQRLEERAAE